MVAVFATCLFLLSPENVIAPSDAEMRKHFLNKRSSFENLVRLIETEPGPVALGISRDIIEDNISKLSQEIDSAGSENTDKLKRWTAYKSLFLDTNVAGIERNWERNERTNRIQQFVLFRFWRSYPAPKPALDELGYLRSKELPENYQLVENTREGLKPRTSLDLNSARERLVRVSRIQDDWYVFFVRWGNIPPTRRTD